MNETWEENTTVREGPFSDDSPRDPDTENSNECVVPDTSPSPKQSCDVSPKGSQCPTAPRRLSRKRRVARRSGTSRWRASITQGKACPPSRTLLDTGAESFQRKYPSTNAFSPQYKDIDDLIGDGLLDGIPQRDVADLSSADREKIRLSSHPDTPLTHALLMAGYDLRLGEKGRGDLKQEISKRTSLSDLWREKCASIARLKHAQIIQLIQFAEICCCIEEALQISDAYWSDVNRKVQNRNSRIAAYFGVTTPSYSKRKRPHMNVESIKPIALARNGELASNHIRPTAGFPVTNELHASDSFSTPRGGRSRSQRWKQRKDTILNFSNNTAVLNCSGSMIEPSMFLDSPSDHDITSTTPDVDVLIPNRIDGVDQWLLDVAVSIGNALHNLTLPSCSKIAMETLSIMRSRLHRQ